MLPLDGYIRVSRVGGRSGEGYITTDEQDRAISEWSERTGTPVFMQPPEEDVSGGTMDRPIFNEIMGRIRRGESGGVVVFRTDRFARSLVGALTTLAEIGKHGGAFASTSEPDLDYHTPSGKAFLNMLFVFAEFTRDSLKESWAIAQRNAIERGIHIAPNGYLGYDRIDKRLVPNSDAPIVVEVFDRRGSGESWGSLAEWLNDVAAKPDGRLWNGQAVQRLCAKRVYRGEASRYVDQDVDDRGAIVTPDAHPALVTEAQWQAAQMNPRIAQGGSHGKPLPLLSGLARCGSCRFGLSQGRGPKGERLYRCRGNHASGRCPSTASILADVLEGHVEGLVLAELEAAVKIVPSSADREHAVDAVDLARRDLDAFKRDRAARRKLGEGEWHEWLDVYLSAVREAEGELDRLNARQDAGTLGIAREHYLALSSDDRRQVLAGFIDGVMVRRSKGRGRNADPIDTRVHILWRGQAPADLPRPRVASPIVPFDFDQHVEAGVATG